MDRGPADFYRWAMNISMTYRLALAAALAAAPAASITASTLIFGNVSGWTVHTDPAEDYRCFAEAQYQGGTLIRLGYGSASLYLGIADPAFGAVGPDSELAVRVSFDDETEFELAVKGAAFGAEAEARGVLAAIPAAMRASFVDDFMQRHTLTVSIEGQEVLELSLAGSYRAAEMLEDCRVSMSRVGAGR